MKQVGALKNDKMIRRLLVATYWWHHHTRSFGEPESTFAPSTLNSHLSLVTPPESTLHITHYTHVLYQIPAPSNFVDLVRYRAGTCVRLGMGFFVGNNRVRLGLRLDYNFTIKHAPRSAMLQHHFIVASIILACLRFSVASFEHINYVHNQLNNHNDNNN
jgi:hypothetical protein